MVIAISAAGADADAPFDPDFGRCPYYCIFDTENARYSAWANPCAGLRSSAAGRSVDFLAGLGVNRVLTGICEKPAREALARAGITVAPCQAPTVGRALADCKETMGLPTCFAPTISHEEALASLGFPVVSPTDAVFAPRLGGRGGGRGGGGCGRGMGGGGRGMGGGGGRGMGGGGRGMSGSGANAVPRPAIPAPSTTRPPATRPRRSGDVPEAKTRRRPQAVIDRTVCTGCGACLDSCPTGALSLQAGKASVDRSLCVGCGACLRACPTGAVSLPRDPAAA